MPAISSGKTRNALAKQSRKLDMEMIQEQIDILIKVQRADAQIYNLKEEQTAKPLQKQLLEDSFNQRQQGLKVKEDSLRSLQLKRKEHEIDLESKEKEIKKYQQQLLQIKTNKEYVALQKEIEALRADNSVLEDDILVLLDKIDAGKVEIRQEKESIVEENKKLELEKSKIDSECAEIDKQIAILEQEKNQLCVNIDKNLLNRYERILKAKRGLALVPIEGESCGGCHRVLPPQVINETQLKEKIITCEFCARLLYWSG